MSPSPFVYIATPIDFAQPSWDVDLTNQLRDAGLSSYHPHTAFRIPGGATPTETLNRINRAALTECHGLVATLPPPGGSSIGVPMEIEMAREQGKPTLIIGDYEVWGRSWALPRTDLVLFAAPSATAASFRVLAGLIAREKRNRNRPKPLRALYTQADPGASLPTRAYSGDAGFDMYTLEDTVIPPGGFVDVPVGLRVQFPDDIWGMIIGRSSTVRKLDLLVTPGVIDSGYRGPLFAGVRSLRADEYVVRKGERLAQMIPFANLAQTLNPVLVDVLTPSDRGESGFGSSGA